MSEAHVIDGAEDVPAQQREIGNTAYLIAYERMIESDRSDGERLFSDPLAKHLSGGDVGKLISEKMFTYCGAFGFEEWPQFHQQWTAVRTKYIDTFIEDEIARLASSSSPPSSFQVVNLGAGVCSRPFRLDCLGKHEATTVFEVDFAHVLKEKTEILNGAVKEDDAVALRCARVPVACDLGDADLLSTRLQEHGFDPSVPSIWILEGLVMYLPNERTRHLMLEIAALSAPSSSILVNFMAVVPDASTPNPAAMDMVSIVKEDGWKNDVKALQYGEEGLSYGRFPDGREPCPNFSIVVAVR
eukprot:TRINITY_DN541_c0_g1_i1.p1 TRINITY_DN541_c0_g1~~TRINITY_DN541_c0_g1_i1.p1  ORF type:complete len:315 (+),score=66.44 TRINITY_DN541_c0_g1_i1:48-947(+)